MTMKGVISILQILTLVAMVLEKFVSGGTNTINSVYLLLFFFYATYIKDTWDANH